MHRPYLYSWNRSKMNGISWKFIFFRKCWLHKQKYLRIIIHINEKTNPILVNECHSWYWNLQTFCCGILILAIARCQTINVWDVLFPAKDEHCWTYLYSVSCSIHLTSYLFYLIDFCDTLFDMCCGVAAKIYAIGFSFLILSEAYSLRSWTFW